eukprot:CAMPEP_0198203678 /NCGR_PEP_ID=MMETSP1445-20131203/7009_1 /TAXON_ID=36898 /ORGANISM="Pyramimonas sp., Strain CCMP2087" /LENGTH=54 /DNA_ID=CAMNT_0043875169 /DNA_START=42 /DNA_END=203 /DNA_ORIENTATION=+
MVSPKVGKVAVGAVVVLVVGEDVTFVGDVGAEVGAPVALVATVGLVVVGEDVGE